MSVDWSQFQDGDKVRVTLEGTWEDDGIRVALGHVGWLAVDGTLKSATSAELIERPFTPPPAGKLFRNGGLFISWGTEFKCIRLDNGDPNQSSIGGQEWSAMAPEWLASIEVLDI